MADIDDIEVPPKKNGMMKLIGAAVVALGAGVGIGYLVLPGVLEASEADEGTELLASVEDLPTFYTLDPFSVNLKGGSRVLRFEVQVQVGDAVPEDLDPQKARLRDSVILLASDYTFRDLEGATGKVRLRDELLARLSSAAVGVDIEDVLFTQFVVQ